MKFVLFYHSLLSDWNHGNAHFLRGICNELISRGHRVDVYEPHDAWSYANLIRECGEPALEDFRRSYPRLESHRYHLETLELDEVLSGADLVIAHEWNQPQLIADLGRKRFESRSFKLLFHDTHHRAVTAPGEMAQYDLRHYDGVLAFGEVLRKIYLEKGWAERAWTWHEAADVTLFRPLSDGTKKVDLVWIGNWGDDERTGELNEFLFNPVARLGLSAKIHGVRYPEEIQEQLRNRGIDYRGWLPNFKAPQVYSEARFTVHIPRRPYAAKMHGIPTIRPFEALACGIPLVSAPWNDVEGLFTPGEDYLVASNGTEMCRHLKALKADPDYSAILANRGLKTIRARHTCAHRVDELLTLFDSL